MNTKSRKQPSLAEKAYHHGDLRNALIISAAEIIEASGSDGFSMMEAARKTGVSSAAPYRHFKDKDDLLESVAELGFYGLNYQLEALCEKYEAGSVDCIISLGHCYVRYVTDRPEFFKLMWGDHSTRAFSESVLGDRKNKGNGFLTLMNQVEAWIRREQIQNTPALEISITLWSLGMGLCHLFCNQQISRFAPALSPYQLLEKSTRNYLDGVKLRRG